MKVPLIALLTDFGLADEYVGVMKGVILKINPQTKIVDVCHDIPPQDIVRGAYLLGAAYKFFPKGTLFVAIDRFGNYITNIDRDTLNKIKFKNLQINFGRFRLNRISGSYSEARAGSPLAIFGSKGLLEISVLN